MQPTDPPHPAHDTAPDPAADRRLVTLNGGSSSIKFAVFTSGDAPARLLSGQIDRIGSPDATLTVKGEAGRPIDRRPLADATDHARAAGHLADFLRERGHTTAVAGIGHRVVHGGTELRDHQVITPEVLAQLHDAQPLDLAHLPREIALIETFGRSFPGVPQVACLDTAFHRDLPRVAQCLPIPRKYIDAGVRRLGFHGLSYTYLMDELRRVAGPAAADGRVILAHLGSGASMAAVRAGRPVDTSMAFTPTAGLVMGTRPGDLDPGLLLYLMRAERLTPEQMDDFVNRRCGLLGVSDTTSDVRDLAARRATDPRAADALDLFCHQARKWIGAFAAALGGLDTLVFSGGIGEHAHDLRAEICQGLDFLGLTLDPASNTRSDAIISAQASRVTVRVIPTDEEIVIARIVGRLLQATR
jgi:acetate kinase